MFHRVETYDDRDGALKARRISASRAAGILGKSPWSSPYSVWAEMTGRLPDSKANPIRFRVGHALEALIGELYEEHTNREVFPEPQNQIQVHPVYPYLTCMLDFTAIDYQKGKGVLDAKTAIISKADEWETGCPEQYRIQLQFQMLCVGRKWGSLAVLVGNNSFKWIDVERDDEFIEGALPRFHQFWVCVQNDIAPPASWQDADVLAQVYPQENGEVIELPADLFQTIDEIRQEAVELASFNTQSKDMADNVIKQYMGEAETALLPGIARYTWKVQPTSNGGLARVFRRVSL